jgi:hypothetical protein
MHDQCDSVNDIQTNQKTPKLKYVFFKIGQKSTKNCANPLFFKL